MTQRILAWGAGAALALLYGYAAVAAVGNLLGMLGIGEALGTGISAVGWAWLVLGLALPPLVFAVALVAGRERAAGTRVLLVAAGLSLVAIAQLNIMHVVPQSAYFV